MKKECKYSEVPVGEQFEYKGKIYVRYTFNRGKQTIKGRISFTRFPKHRIVEWIDAY